MRKILAVVIAFWTIIPDVRGMTVRDGTEFVKALSEKGMEVLRDEGLSRDKKKERFHALYRSHFDHEAIAKFILGRSFAAASVFEKQQMYTLLDEYIVELLIGNLGQYFGNFRNVVWEVTYWKPDGDGIEVFSHVNNGTKHLNVKWRLRKEGESFLIRDVYFEHLSLALTQRREFTKLFVDAGDRVDVFIGKLRGLIEGAVRLGIR